MSNKLYETQIEEFNDLLRGEISAIETYNQVIEKIEDNSQLVPTLVKCKESHVKRADMLSMKVHELHGEPVTDSGVWGAFAKFMEGGAKLFGEKAAVSVLEEGEDYGLSQYRESDELSITTRSFVDSVLLPEQKKTHAILSDVKNRIN